MKQVVTDIQEMFKPNQMPEISDEWCDDLASKISSMLKSRLQERTKSSALRLSSLGKGNRYLWYTTRLNTPKEELSPSTRIKFLFGDLVEELFISLIKLSGHAVTEEQATVELEGIVGHIDCLVDGKLVDIKSASTFGFKKFKEQAVYMDDPFGYCAQLAAYEEASGHEAVGWLAMDKAMGHICFSELKKQHHPDMRERAIKVQSVVKSKIEPAPCAYPVPDGKSGNEKLPTTCSYCQFKEHCWRDSNDGQGLRKFMYSNSPRWLTHVEVLPKVLEITGDK